MGEAIFISYRRSDTGGHAGRLFDRLQHWFDGDALFYDLDGIDSGETFPSRIEQALVEARVVLVVIGPDWLATLGERAAASGVDFVRQEVAQALARHALDESMLVVPVLMGGAQMPSAEALHETLRATLGPLCALDAQVFQGKQADWDAQYERLRERIAAVEGVPTPRFRSPSGVEQPYHVIDQALSVHFTDPESRLPALRASLEGGGNVAVVARAALYGMGGVGKTQLALKYCQDYRDKYAGVWWFRAESESTLQLDAQACCNAVGASQNEGELPSVALKRWLERQPVKWLLVFDNAEDGAALRPHLPEGARHHVVITSRNPAWGGVATPFELDTWTPEQGAHFLAERLPQAEREELRALALALGGLPLALEQAASYLEETTMALEEYRRLLDGIDSGAAILERGDLAAGYEHSVVRTLSLSFEQLSTGAKALLRLCAYAAPEPLPERIFREAPAELPEPLSAAAGDPLAWNDLIGELRRYGLVSRVDIPTLDREPGDSSGGIEQALSLHRLTQQVARARLAVPEADCRALQAVLRASFPGDVQLPAHWPRCAALVEHVIQLDRFYDAGCLHTDEFSWLLDRAATYLQHGPALYADAVRVFRRALSINTETLGEEHPDTLRSMNNVAFALWNQGDLAGARELEEQVLEVRKRVLGEEHPDTLRSMNNLAITRRAQGDPAGGARALQEQVLAVQKRVLGEEHPETLTSMNNLAGTLWQIDERQLAVQLAQAAADGLRRTLGEEHPNTKSILTTLAQWRHALASPPPNDG